MHKYWTSNAFLVTRNKAVLQANGSRIADEVHTFNAFYVPFCNKQESVHDITGDQLYMKSLTDQLWISLHIKVWNHFYVLSKEVTAGTTFPLFSHVLMLIHSREEWRTTISRKFLHENYCIDKNGPDQAGQCSWTIKSLLQSSTIHLTPGLLASSLRFWSWQTECPALRSEDC